LLLFIITIIVVIVVILCVDVCSGTLEDTELVEGLVFNQKTAGAGGPKRVEKAKIGLIQFCISPPKTDVRFFSANA